MQHVASGSSSKCNRTLLQLQSCGRYCEMQPWQNFLWRMLPVLLYMVLAQQQLGEAYMKSVLIEEIPFGMAEASHGQAKSLHQMPYERRPSGMQLIAKWEKQRSFFHLFHVPYIVCFFAAKGKWPFIPPFMQARVDNAARGFFSQNDSIIKTFCKKFIQRLRRMLKCLSVMLDKQKFAEKGNETITVEIETLAAQRCNCNKLLSTESTLPVVYFDKNYIGNVSGETILNTIEFLESFLPPPTKKSKRKNRVRGRIDEIDVD